MADMIQTDDPPFIRISFGDDRTWESVVETATSPSEEGFLPLLSVVDDLRFFELDPFELISRIAPERAIAFFADKVTMEHEDHPILCIALLEGQKSLRVVPSELWSIENNISLANMDFDDFLVEADSDGIFRGFK